MEKLVENLREKIVKDEREKNGTYQASLISFF